MNSEELVNLAGKSMGWIDYPTDSIEQGMWWHVDPVTAPFGHTFHKDNWTPLTDTHDAMMLIFKHSKKGMLRLLVSEQSVVCYYNHDGMFVPVMFGYDNYSTQEALCLAITYAAAELGKLMK